MRTSPEEDDSVPRQSGGFKVRRPSCPRRRTWNALFRSSAGLRVIVIGKEVLRILYDDPAEENQREQVWNGHEAVADVRRVPEKLHADERTEGADHHVQHPVNLYPVSAEQKSKGGFTV